MWESGNNSQVPKADSSDSDFREIFDKALEEHNDNHQGSQKKPWTQARLDEVINEIKTGTDTLLSGLRRTAMEYYWMSKYEIITVGDEEHLIFKRSCPEDLSIRIVPREQYYDFLTEIHVSSEHGGRDKMLHCIKSKYYIPKKAVEIFVSLCPKCHNKRNTANKEGLARQNHTHKFNIRGQVDLIDFQSCPDGQFQWVLNYQDDASKFLSLRPLRTNEAAEVASELIKIFLTFGAPTILQLDNRHVFAEKLKEELSMMWSDCEVVHKNTQVKGNNKEVEELLRSWMTENNSTKWSVGCYVVQYVRNNSINRLMGKSSYKTMFGCDPKVTLCALNFAAVCPTPEIEIQLKVELKDEPSDNVPGLSSDEDC